MYAENSVALVTGAATGIGLETALAFARAGCRVVISDCDALRGEAAAAQVRALGCATLFVACDVSLPGQVEQLHRRAMAAFGRLDAACTMPASRASRGIPPIVLWRTLTGSSESTCVGSSFACASSCASCRPRAAALSSTWRLVGFAGLPAYCASKGGVGEVADAVVWLCSPAAGFVTGQALAVDGGLVAR